MLPPEQKTAEEASPEIQSQKAEQLQGTEGSDQRPQQEYDSDKIRDYHVQTIEQQSATPAYRIERYEDYSVRRKVGAAV